MDLLTEEFSESQCLTWAQMIREQGNLSTAFEAYLYIFKKWPHLKDRKAAEFRLLVAECNSTLYPQHEKEIMITFKRAMEVYPNNQYLLEDLGEYLGKYQHYSEAMRHHQLALRLDPGFVTPEYNFNVVKRELVERWHYCMLNDIIRNRAFYDALKAIIIPGKDKVLDVGTGSGLLAMYAKMCNPKSVIGCEYNNYMVAIANAVFTDNNITDISVIPQESTELTPHVLNGKATLVIAEVFDAGLLGEQVLRILKHAWENLISKTGRICPFRAEFFAIGVNSKDLYRNYHLDKEALETLNIPDLCVHVGVESYDCEDATRYRDLKYVTEPASVFKFDFNSLSDIIDKLEMTEPKEVHFKMTESSTVNLVLGWFNLHLTEEIMITTNPKDSCRAKAWEQAVFHNFPPKQANRGDSMSLHFSCNGDNIAIVESRDNAIAISDDLLMFLNDTEYMQMLINSLPSVYDYLCQLTNVKELVLLDFCPFPLLGFLLMKRGAVNLTCFARSGRDEAFILKVFAANNICTDNVTILMESQIYEHEFTDCFHFICNHLTLSNGGYDPLHRFLVQSIMVNNTLSNTLIAPFEVKLHGLIVESDWLEDKNAVKDSNTFCSNIAAHMNKYQVSYQGGIRMEQLKYRTVTNPTPISTINRAMSQNVINVEVLQDAEANALVCWFEIKLLQNGPTISTNRKHSFCPAGAYLANPRVSMRKGNTANILLCVEQDVMYKLIIDVD